ncbi:MAG: PASTA domain-containing protein [Bifidobacteriaceae bacterium]|nr:PASTA domain-containing protein [Bifidobacteriaceae bacterium]
MLVALALVTGGAAGGAYWYFAFGPGSLVSVPDVAGAERAIAEAELAAADLAARVELINSDGVAAGLVISTDPPTGERLEPGSIVTLTVSLGIKMVSVPGEGVIGVGVDEAKSVLAAAGLDGEVATELVYHTEVAQGLVISVTPEAEATVAHNIPVTLVVSQGPEPVDAPQLTDLTLAEAQAAADPFELTVVKGSEEYSETVAEGLIISQDPTSGTGTHRGAEISVVVSLGMPFVEVPNLFDMPYDSAVAALAERGLKAERAGASWGLNRVLLSDPPARTDVRKGSTVTLTVV